MNILVWVVFYYAITIPISVWYIRRFDKIRPKDIPLLFLFALCLPFGGIISLWEWATISLQSAVFKRENKG